MHGDYDDVRCEMYYDCNDVRCMQMMVLQNARSHCVLGCRAGHS